MGAAKRVGADGSDACRRHVGYPLAEAPQAADCALLSLWRQPSGLVEARGKLHHLAKPIHDDGFAGAGSRDDHVEAVGAEVDCGDGSRDDGRIATHDAAIIRIAAQTMTTRFINIGFIGK